MLSSTEQRRSVTVKRMEHWNRKLHYYLGLYFLLFIWLFALTGLLLNHPAWSFADFWPSRKQTRYDAAIQVPQAAGDLAQARGILTQLGIEGEIQWTKTRAQSSRLEFQVSRPGRIFQIDADLATRRARVERIDVNGWGVIRMLHTFSGVRANDSRNARDWTLTGLWAFSMDATAAGLIVMVLGSYYMWWRLPGKRRPGTIALAAGVIAAGLFCLGLRLIV